MDANWTEPYRPSPAQVMSQSSGENRNDPSLYLDCDQRLIRDYRIFWAVSVPLAAIIGISLMSPIPGWIKKRWENSERGQRYTGVIKGWSKNIRGGSKKRKSYRRAITEWIKKIWEKSEKRQRYRRAITNWFKKLWDEFKKRQRDNRTGRTDEESIALPRVLPISPNRREEPGGRRRDSRIEMTGQDFIPRPTDSPSATR